MSTFWRLAGTHKAPFVATVAVATSFIVPSCPPRSQSLRCDAPQSKLNDSIQPITRKEHVYSIDHSEQAGPSFREGMQVNAQGSFHGLFPLRQLFVPAMPYPLWNKNWDGSMHQSTADEEEDRRVMQYLRKHGVTRHIILVRHGQYDETYKEDEKRTLTPLGREQAHMTGKRIAEMMHGAEESFGPCKIKSLRVSALTRAIETANIIATYLPGIQVEEHDPLLNEGRPCHTIPGGPATDKVVEMTDAQHPRIEASYRKYFYRAPMPKDKDDETSEKHEFEIIVCHANVIRYFLCRALQLPPEAWLRYCPFNCSLTYLTIRATGTVSCRMLGDIGHLPYRACTFSGHHGFNW